MLQVVSTGTYYPPLDTAERVLLPQHPTLQRGHCAFCQDFRWLVGFVVPPQYLTILSLLVAALQSEYTMAWRGHEDDGGEGSVSQRKGDTPEG